MEETNVLAPDNIPASEPIKEVNWAESEWFQNWLRLARRDYHGQIKQAPAHKSGHRK